MVNQFRKIGLFAKHNNKSVAETLEKLIQFLKNHHLKLSIETESASLLTHSSLAAFSKEEIGKNIDLAIVVGGDGSMLNAARAVAPYQIPILGINRGRLGFLADILPEQLESELAAILQGNLIQEKRFLLEAKVVRNGQVIAINTALNDVVLYSGSSGRMIDFEVYINDIFVLRQQADGMIAATPTGSTAYALSAGGPILFPTLPAMTLTPLCPHTLSNRPLVVDNSCHIRLKVTQQNDTSPKLSSDGQLHCDLLPEDEIHIQKYAHELTLIHPLRHEYFSILREKLGWNTQQTKD